MNVLWIALLVIISASPQRQARASGGSPLALAWRCGLADLAPSAVLQTTLKGHPTHSESAANIHPGFNDPATKVHPTSLTVEVNYGPCVTLSDSDDRAGGPESSKKSRRSMQAHLVT